MSKKIYELNKLISELPKEKSGEIASFIETKLELLKICYDKSSDEHHKKELKFKIKYTPLKCFIAESKYRGKPVEIGSIAYDEKTIRGHIENGLPKTHHRRGIEIYNFYFGGYKTLFQCLTKGFLEKTMKFDMLFLEDIFSESKVAVVEVVNQLKSQILGATIIDKEFVSVIKKKEFSMAEFYTAKQNEDCQWYGIIQQWDIERTVYTKVKSAVENCFEKERSYKVSSVIHGDGGCGKSTLLRRLAIDLSSSEEFKVIWIDDFEEFINGNSQNIFSGWEMIKNDFSNKYIVFIEDWYSKVDYNDIVHSKKFLKNAEINRNVRIVIGDRSIQGKYYLEHLYNDNNKFLLLPAENKFILENVIQKIPEWETVIKEEFMDKLGNAPLFMLLFIIAKVNDGKEFSDIDLCEPQKAFQNIIKNSLNQLIEYNCLGLAKALHYWGCIYSEFRILIPYEGLLRLAEHFNTKNDRIPKDYKNLQLNSKITRTLNTYIGVKVYNKKNNQQVFYFNHDILSDSGLSIVSFKDWDIYDDLMLKSILNVFVDKGDDISTSVFLQRMIRLKPSLFEGKQEKLEYINKLIDRKVRHYTYTLPLATEIPISLDELDSFADKLWCFEYDNNVFWSHVLTKKELQEKWTRNILNSFSISKSSPDLIFLVLKHTKNKKEDELVQMICEKILKEDVLCIHPSFVIIGLKFSNDRGKDGLVQQACQKILEGDILNISSEIVSKALNLSENQKQKQEIEMLITKSKSKDSNYRKIVYRYLKCYATQKSIPSFVKEYVNEIIYDFNEEKKWNSQNSILFYDLLKIPFHSIPKWKAQTKWIIKNWEKLHRINIYNVLLSYRTTHSSYIQNVCREILINWRREAERKLYKANRQNQYADHLIFSMGHPNLRSEILQIANEINTAILNEKLEILDYLKVVVENIVNNNVYPKWNEKKFR